MDRRTPLEKGISLIKADCSLCPYMRLLDYPVCYCLFGVVDYSTLCPFDYDTKRAKREYETNKDCIEYWYDTIKPLIRE